MSSRAAAAALGGGALAVAVAAPARATPESMRAAVLEVTRGVAPREGRVSLDLPPLVENGNAVPLTVSVESPMTAADHVRAIHVFNEKNPQPHVFAATIGPRAGRAVISTRIKLGDSQRIVAIAETSDGVFWTAGVDVIVTLAACLEELT
ncbi:MAG: SoxY-related AACIE arm protein [Rhodospirillales bacterium]|nr:MAG: SoxY-related AACIE arm protein [Rhodospirillales bacterium]